MESAAIVWDLILNCLNILDITDEEAYGVWSILAAIYHLGYAGVKQGWYYTLNSVLYCTVYLLKVLDVQLRGSLIQALQQGQLLYWVSLMKTWLRIYSILQEGPVPGSPQC